MRLDVAVQSVAPGLLWQGGEKPRQSRPLDSTHAMTLTYVKHAHRTHITNRQLLSSPWRRHRTLCRLPSPSLPASLPSLSPRGCPFGSHLHHFVLLCWAPWQGSTVALSSGKILASLGISGCFELLLSQSSGPLPHHYDSSSRGLDLSEFHLRLPRAPDIHSASDLSTPTCRRSLPTLTYTSPTQRSAEWTQHAPHEMFSPRHTSILVFPILE